MSLAAIVEQGQAPGLVVGELVRGKRTVQRYGSVLPAGRCDDADVVFEIGSLTKPLTGLLLCVLICEGTVAPDDRLARFLPAAIVRRAPATRAILLSDLATHTASLPRLPLRLLLRGLRDPRDPYAGVTVTDLYRALPHLVRRRGRFRYSNYGYMLLAHALTVAAGAPFAALVAHYIGRPLGLQATTLLDNTDPARLVQGHTRRGMPVPPWQVGAALGAGGLVSSARDLLCLLDACLGNVPADLAAPLALALWPRIVVQQRALAISHGGWFITRAGPAAILFHNGATAGCSSFAGFCPDRGTGIVVLVNAAYRPAFEVAALTELARHG